MAATIDAGVNLVSIDTDCRAIAGEIAKGNANNAVVARAIRAVGFSLNKRWGREGGLLIALASQTIADNFLLVFFSDPLTRLQRF